MGSDTTIGDLIDTVEFEEFLNTVTIVDLVSIWVGMLIILILFALVIFALFEIFNKKYDAYANLIIFSYQRVGNVAITRIFGIPVYKRVGKSFAIFHFYFGE